MSERTASRRTVLKTVGAALGVAAVPATVSAGEQWTSVESPTGNTLHDVEYTAAGAYAVGGGGVVLERTPTGWQKVIDGGPTGNGNSLYGADVTDDDKRLWFVGSSGAIGEYDVEAGNLNDRSAPMDVTNNLNDVSVTGSAGEANVYVAGDSGKMYFSFENGEQGTWESVTPGSGSNINAVDFYDDRKGHIVDGNKSVFHTQDGATWTPADTGDAGLRDIEVTGGGGDGLTAGGGGKVYDLSAGKWAQEAAPTGQKLKAVVRGDPDIAVGSGGTIIER
jgi:hypothetical protein